MRKKLVRLSLLLAMLVVRTLAAMTLSSEDLQPGAVIAAAQIYPRCGGENVSPQLTWSGAPPGTKSLALTMIDTSVQPARWSHWVIVGLPPDTTSLPRGAKILPAPARGIQSNFGDSSYDGPCPPTGSGVHQYQVTIWALSTPGAAIAPDMKATDLERLLGKLALARASLVGTLSR